MKQGKKKHSKLKVFLCGILIMVLLLGTVSTLYVMDYYHATKEAAEALESSDAVTVIQQKKQIIFSPENPKAGMIFYPGGKVAYEAYAPLMQACAKRGILCILLQMPGNLAVLDVDAADHVKEAYPDITKWYMAGHSLGGSMAASYIGKHTTDYEGLILLAAYSTENLQNSNLRVLSIYGTNDGVLNKEKYKENFTQLPADTTEYIIEGGCHSGFGDYGIQKHDGKPEITKKRQRDITADVICEFVSEGL